MTSSRGASVGPSSHRAQDLLIAFFGSIVHRRGLPPIPTGILLQVLSVLGHTPTSVRAALARMVQKGLLERTQVGREARYSVAPETVLVFDGASRRIHAPFPFEHGDGQWTLLSFSLPEELRDLRYRFRATLLWSGFGGIRDGLWISPGTVDVGRVLRDARLERAAAHAEWFTASPGPGVDTRAMICRAWDVEAIRTHHERFVERWTSIPKSVDVLAETTALHADWLKLLRADPGLPTHLLGEDWPSSVSAAVYSRANSALEPGVVARLEALSFSFANVASRSVFYGDQNHSSDI